MGALVKFVLFLHLAAAVLIAGLMFGIATNRIPPPPEAPVIEDKWFGKGQRVKEDESIRPFKIEVDNKVIETLMILLSVLNSTNRFARRL